MAVSGTAFLIFLPGMVRNTLFQDWRRISKDDRKIEGGREGKVGGEQGRDGRRRITSTWLYSGTIITPVSRWISWLLPSCPGN